LSSGKSVEDGVTEIRRSVADPNVTETDIVSAASVVVGGNVQLMKRAIPRVDQANERPLKHSVAEEEARLRQREDAYAAAKQRIFGSIAPFATSASVPLEMAKTARDAAHAAPASASANGSTSTTPTITCAGTPNSPSTLSPHAHAFTSVASSGFAPPITNGDNSCGINGEGANSIVYRHCSSSSSGKGGKKGSLHKKAEARSDVRVRTDPDYDRSQVRWKTMRHPSLDYNDAISSSPFAHGVVVGPVSGGAAPGFTGPSAVPVASSFLRRQNAFPMQMQPVHHRPQSSQSVIHLAMSASSSPMHPQAHLHTTPVVQPVFPSVPLRAMGCNTSTQLHATPAGIAKTHSVHDPVSLNDSASGMSAEKASGSSCCTDVSDRDSSSNQHRVSFACLEQQPNAREAHHSVRAVGFSHTPAEDISSSFSDAAEPLDQLSRCCISSASSTKRSAIHSSVASVQPRCDTFPVLSAIPEYGVGSSQLSLEASNAIYSREWPPSEESLDIVARSSVSTCGPVITTSSTSSVEHRIPSHALISASDPIAALFFGTCTSNAYATPTASDRSIGTAATSTQMTIGCDAGDLRGGILANAYAPPLQPASLGLVTTHPDATHCAIGDEIAGRGTSSSADSGVSKVGDCHSLSGSLMAGIEVGTKPNAMASMEVGDIGRLALPPPLALDSLSGLLTPAPLPLPISNTALREPAPLLPFSYSVPTHPGMSTNDTATDGMHSPHLHNAGDHSGGLRHGGGRSSGKGVRGCRSQSCCKGSADVSSARGRGAGASHKAS